MKNFLSTLRIALLAAWAIGLTASTAEADNGKSKWKGSTTGTTTPDLDRGVDVDVVKGKQNVLGRFTGLGEHVLNPVDFTFVGQATWKGRDGDKLFVTYTGQVFPSGDPDFPYGFVAELRATGGTGDMRGGYRGKAVMTGAFTGIPGELYFDFEGHIRLHDD